MDILLTFYVMFRSFFTDILVRFYAMPSLRVSFSRADFTEKMWTFYISAVKYIQFRSIVCTFL